MIENRYLEKIAESDSDRAMGSGINRAFTGAFSINSRLKRQGYDSSLSKVIHTSSKGLPFKKNLKEDVIATGGGAASGKILVDIPIGKSPWRILLVPFNIDKTSTAPGTPKSISIGVGRAF